VSIFIDSPKDVTFEYTALCTLEVLSSKPSCEIGYHDMLSTVFLHPSRHMPEHYLRVVHGHFLSDHHTIYSVSETGFCGIPGLRKVVSGFMRDENAYRQKSFIGSLKLVGTN
jgi:hypothetical protein